MLQHERVAMRAISGIHLSASADRGFTIIGTATRAPAGHIHTSSVMLPASVYFGKVVNP